jgi:hypothetical protein
MSVKSVPGCLVAIAPTGIGLPVAFAPGLLPHCEVSTLEPVALALLLALLDAPPALVVVVVDLLLPQPARTIITPTATTATMSRTRGTCW